MQTLKFLFLCISTKFFLFFKGFECQTLAFRGVKGYLVSIVSKYTQFILHSYTLYKQKVDHSFSEGDIREKLNLSKYFNSCLEKDANLTKTNLVPPTQVSFSSFQAGPNHSFSNNTPFQILVQCTTMPACSITYFPFQQKNAQNFLQNS